MTDKIDGTKSHKCDSEYQTDISTISEIVPPFKNNTTFWEIYSEIYLLELKGDKHSPKDNRCLW